MQEKYKLFPGFKSNYSKGYFKYPIEMESYWYLLKGSEQKVLDFILRQTIGYQKMEDTISLSQFVRGIGSKNQGTGVSRSQVQRCLESLQEKGFIKVIHRKFRTNLIRLVIDESFEDDDSYVGHYDIKDLEYFIEMFEEISPHRVDEFMKSKAQQKAIARLLNHYGQYELEQYIQKVIDFKDEPYLPMITTPVELERKLSSFLTHISRLESVRN